MIPRTIGDTGVSVSPVALALPADEGEQEALGHFCSRALERGITFFDIAGGGEEAEAIFGRWYARLGAAQQQQVQICAGVGGDGAAGNAADRQREPDFSRGRVRQALDASLVRLQAEAVDVCLLRHIRLPEFREEVFDELERARQEGKIRCWGVCLGPEIGWREEGFEAIQRYGARCVQTIYNCFEQHPGREISQLARSYRAGMIARCPYHFGTLLGRPQVPASEAAWAAEKLRRIGPILERSQLLPHQFALRWILQSAPEWASISLPLRSRDDVETAASAVEGPAISDDDMRLLQELYNRDFDLPPESRPPDLRSSVAPGGTEPSRYVAPPTMLA